MMEGVWDTPSAIEARFRTLLLARSGGERIRMACEMFETARRLVVASLPPAVAADPTARTLAVLDRTYRADLEATPLAWILTADPPRRSDSSQA